MNEIFCELGGDASRCLPAFTALRLLFSALLAVLFLQSGIDKIVDREGNLGWLQGHFSKTPFRNMVPLLVSIITVMEIAAGATSAVGALALVTTGSRTLGVIGALLSAVTLLNLFVGQRIAKDYPGAMSIAEYFGLVMVGTWIYLL